MYKKIFFPQTTKSQLTSKICVVQDKSLKINVESSKNVRIAHQNT